MATKKTTASAKRKVAPKKVAKNYLVLASRCGDVCQGEYYSEHATQQQARAAATTLMAGQEHSYDLYDGAFVVKLLGKVVTKTTTEYEDVA